MSILAYITWDQARCRRELDKLQRMQSMALTNSSGNGVAMGLANRSLQDIRTQIHDLVGYMFHCGWIDEAGPFLQDREELDFRRRRPPAVDPCQCQDVDGEVIAP